MKLTYAKWSPSAHSDQGLHRQYAGIGPLRLFKPAVLISPSFSDRPSRGPRTGKPMSPQRNPS
jgi:hypothetical protein